MDRERILWKHPKTILLWVLNIIGVNTLMSMQNTNAFFPKGIKAVIGDSLILFDHDEDYLYPLGPTVWIKHDVEIFSHMNGKHFGWILPLGWSFFFIKLLFILAFQQVMSLCGIVHITPFCPVNFDISRINRVLPEKFDDSLHLLYPLTVAARMNFIIVYFRNSFQNTKKFGLKMAWMASKNTNISAKYKQNQPGVRWTEDSSFTKWSYYR